MTPSWRDNNVVVLGVNALKSNLYMKFVVNAISARANFEFYEGWIGVDFEGSTMHTTIGIQFRFKTYTNQQPNL